jgi:hypothetical protein
MSILDDAIREHLELKRAHGADDAELKKLEDEAFGPPARPGEDPLAEAPTEFLAAPGMDAGQAAAEAGEGGGRRAPNITDLQEAPEPQEETDASEPAEEPEAAAPAEEPSPSAEHQAIPDPPAEDSADSPPEIDSGPSTEERHAIAEQPTEFFDVEADLGAGSEQKSPTDEELIDSKLSEPRLAPVDPPSGIDASGPDPELADAPAAGEDEEDDDFFSEQRLSDELNNALETPVDDEEEVFAPNVTPPSDEQPLAPATDEHESGPFTDEHDALGTDEHEAFPTTDEHETEDDFDEEEEDAPKPPSPASEHEDVLEDTPDFLEDAPEDDNLWFEQQPPKDFDFDD